MRVSLVTYVLWYLCGDGDITKALLVCQVLKGGHYVDVGLEVIPAKAELSSNISVSNWQYLEYIIALQFISGFQSFKRVSI